jgi:hypothetical protein
MEAALRSVFVLEIFSRIFNEYKIITMLSFWIGFFSNCKFTGLKNGQKNNLMVLFIEKFLDGIFFLIASILLLCFVPEMTRFMIPLLFIISINIL